ncbi:ABC transporter permease [Sphingomonas sp. KR1UV-12]|uniref:ABC transporter permease n=1 Tax=Sphingomonas aurea TaxID=3063994 RepID=A0ABT9ENP9_9SPHN|nr:ABC transporter permease [Sphingomonas sp. KR1UV-12]MDP1028441.1 ABC transporter permease [Sphingomonas sp. KR1UV-12]
MNSFALLSLYRSLTRHKLYAALNIGGLAVGIAVFLILSLYVRFETSFERWLPGYDGIYLVQTENKGIDSPFTGTYPNTMGGLLEQMKQDFPDIVGTRFNSGSGTVLRDGTAREEDIARVDADFFKVFDLPMVVGDKASALSDPTAIILSRSAARRYFGDVDPVGRTLTLSFDKPATYHVTGVFEDLPRNSDFKVSIIARQGKDFSSWWYHWGSTSLYTYLRFDTPAAARAFEQRMPAFIKRRGTPDMGDKVVEQIGLPLLPLADAHLQPAGKAVAAKKMTIITLGIVGVLTLLIAVVNYVNLATARAGLRAREVAMRKVLGADHGMLVRQFLGEAVMTVALAALAGLILAELGLPLVNAAGGLTLGIPYAVVVPALVILALVIGTLAGIYPALLLARWPASQVLSSARAPGGGRAGTRVREALVVFQFALAITFLVGTTVLVAQTRHIRSTDLGFRREGLLVLRGLSDDSLDKGRRLALVAALRRLPGVEAVTTANSAVGNTDTNNFDNLDVPGKPKPGPSLREIEVGRNFFETYGTRLIAGRVFDDAHPADDAGALAKGSTRNIVINRLAVAKLGYASPQDAIGKTVGGGSQRTIIGVVDQLRFFSPRLPDDPTYYTYYGDLAPYPIVTLRFTGDPRPFKAAVQTLWQKMAPQVPFMADTGNQALAKFYEDDDRATRLFGIGAGLAVLIGCVGLWGLASFNTARRIKEIGIRKTLGASSADIVRLLVGQFLRPVLIANLVAWPLAFVAMRTWLAGFDDRIALSPLYFVGASLLATAIAVLTVLGQSLRASRAAPAWALRHE